MHTVRDYVQPALNPYWETLAWQPGITVGVTTLAANAPDKPYKVKRGSAWVTQVRVGTATRDASREEEQRLYPQSGQLRYGLTLVLGTSLADLDHRRVRDCLMRGLEEEVPAEDDPVHWESLGLNLELATVSAGHTALTVNGMLLLGLNPGRFLPQSSLRAICYPGTEPDYAVRADEDIKGLLAPLDSLTTMTVEPGHCG